MRIRTVLLFVIVAFAAYAGYGYAVTHFNRASLAYQNFAAALMRDEVDKARLFAWDGNALAPFNFAGERNHDLMGGQIKFEYYDITSFYYNEDGSIANIEAVHTVRVDPPGTSSVFGAVAVSVPERIQVEQRDGVWRVKTFNDTYTLNHLKQLTAAQ
jgi:hypothetical protein